MTSVVDRTATTVAASRPWRRRRPLLLLAIVLSVASLTSIFTVRHLDGQYGPIEGGSFSGPYSMHDLVVDSGSSSQQLANRPEATAQLIGALENRGAHSVKVTWIELDGIATSIRWSEYRSVAGGDITGVPTPWRPFPAIVPATGRIRLLITIHHPDTCGASALDRAAIEPVYRGVHRVHWDSLLHSRTTFVTIVHRDVGVC
jgi:hypothetical protein